MEAKRLNSSCISCITKNHLENYPEDASEEKKLTYMQKVLKILSEMESDESGPIMSGRIFTLQEQLFGESQSFAEIKHTYNELILGKEEEIFQMIQSAEDPMQKAMRFAMTGNYIDFGALSSVDNEKLEELLMDTEQNVIDPKEYENLKEDLSKASTLVYLTDNCGEIVLDKLLIKILKEQYPKLDITVIVRGEEILNDATMKDARQVGMTELVKVIGNGSNVAGTWLKEVSKEASDLIHQADVIISKGQGNFETLWGCGENIYYMFLCKCELFTRRFGMKQFQGILVNDKRCQEQTKERF